MFLSIVSCCEALNFKIRGKFIESDIVFQFASINIHATIGVNGLVFMQGRTLWDMAYMEVAMLFSCKLVRNGLLIDCYPQNACFGQLLVVGRDLGKETIQSK